MEIIRLKSIVLMLILSFFCFGGISCSDNGTEEETGAIEGDVPLTSIRPILDWGVSVEEIKQEKAEGFTLLVETDTLLRYLCPDDVVLDYKFVDNGLIAASLTQKGISSFDKINKDLLSRYDVLSESEANIIGVSKDHSTLLCGKLFQGNESGYLSFAWTVIREEDENMGPDYSPSGTINGHDYVDLGIGIGWATCNVGANSMEEAGRYYMWGETLTHSDCYWTNYSLYLGDPNTYRDDSKFYTPYTNISGTSYDAARKWMGGSWRMPTRAEFSALFNNCKVEAGTYNDVNGFIITGPSGKSIFIPKAGRQRRESIRELKTVYLWSSTNYDNVEAYYAEMRSSNDEDVINVTYYLKFYGLPIRGVVDLE